MIVVDASVLIAFLDAKDIHHGAAVELLAEAHPPLLVHPISAAEVLVAPVRHGVDDEVWADLSPRDDKGQVDRTHLNAKGSDVVARLLVDALRKAVPELSVYLAAGR